MGRLTVAGAENPYVRYPRIKVTVYDPWFSKKLRISDGQILYPIRGSIGPGPYGGTGEFLHTAHAFSSFQEDDVERLMGCYIIVSVKGDVVWAGTITKVQYQQSASESSGVNQVTYHARDLWHAVADKAIRGVFYGTGLTVEHLLLYIQGKPFSVPISIGGTSTSPSGQRYLPCNKNGDIIVDINEESFETATSWTWSHAYSNIDIASLICDVAGEKRFDMVGIRSNEIGSETIGTIEAISYSEIPKALIIGAPSESDFESPAYLPRATSIVGDMDMTGATTEIRAIGGEVTESCSVQLIPAWPSELNQALLDDPVKAYKEPHVYGGVGRLWYLDVSPIVANIIPFNEFAEPRFYSDSDTWKNHPGNATDGLRIWEYLGNVDDVDKEDDSLWKETNDQFIVTQYNDDYAFTKTSRFGQMARLGWFNKKLGLVIFKEPQLRQGWSYDEEGKLIRDYNLDAPKTLVFQGVRSRGQLGYNTGHKGPFPRPRWRYLSNPDWTKHIDTHYSGLANFFNRRYTMGREGREERTGAMPFDATQAMISAARRTQREKAKPENNITITISGIDRSWWLGDWIKQLMDTDGNVVKDNLEWYVQNIEYEFETVTTILSLGEDHGV